MDNLRILLPAALAFGLMGSASALARPRFIASEIESRASIILYCDLDGDALKDIALVDGTNVFIFYQEPKRGFNRVPQQRHQLEARPAVVWPARLGRNAESLLVMTSEGVTELCFTNRAGPPMRRQIIQQPTLIPESLEEPRVEDFCLAAKTDSAWPLLLVPAADGLQVWSAQPVENSGAAPGEWHRSQFIEAALTSRIAPKLSNPGFNRTTGFSGGLSDVNHDGRDDLTLRRRELIGTEIYTIYFQNPNGIFGPEPALSYTNEVDRRSWLCWLDLNRDGKVDLIKSVWPDEPSFLPGFPSGKVQAGAYLADERGRLPAEPQAIFRKYDWTPALPIVDLDGDGYVDVILAYCFFDKEHLRRQIMTKQLELSLRFFFGRPGGNFPKGADCQREVSIHLERSAMIFGWGQHDFFELFINYNGDFDGDGKNDLLVRDHSDQISIYFFVSRERGFSQSADLKFDCADPIDWLEARDLNGDGVSDLIVKVHGRDVFRVFISEGK